MENRTDGSGVAVLIFIIIFVFAFIVEMGFIGMIIAYALMTSYMNNFVLKPMSKKMSAKNYTPNNYMYRKLQNTRLVIWIISAILGFSLIFIIEIIAIAISVAKINEIKRNLGIPIKAFSKHDYLIYEEYSKFSEDDEYNGYEKDDESYTNKNNFFNTSVKHKKVETIIEQEATEEDKAKKLEKEIEDIKNELYKTITEEPLFKEIKKLDFNKPIGEISKVEPIKTSTSSIWEKPVGDNSTNDSNMANIAKTDKIEPTEDEIRCEKCGTIMSKMKIACPKCGALVKNSYRTGK